MIIPKKSLGQNFLIDKNISKKIVNLVKDISNKYIIEIGPGKGFLTDEIIKKNPKNLYLIEKDKILYQYLREKYQNNKNINIINEDALKYNYSLIKKPKAIIANLPYNISIKLLINWMKELESYNEIVTMIQKEVAEKMNYVNKLKKNRLNVMTEICSNYKIEFNVSNQVFFPKPKIKSSVIKISYKKKYDIDLYKFENFTRHLFRHKRKKISNVLDFYKFKKVNKLEIGNMRSEDLNIKQIIEIFNEYC